MPEVNDNRKVFSLQEVALSIQKTISMRYSSSFWVKAEMNKLNYYPNSGHCYPDLVEKVDGKIIAQMKANLWRDDYLRINRNFIDLVKTPLKEGITMLCCARITFEPLHGLALRIVDIDPVFSLGELEREKQESVMRLKKEGLFDRNRALDFPLLPKRLAVISVQTSKGYADFLKVITTNEWGYGFVHMLFPSLLQGDKAVDAILYQLRRIRKIRHHFDVVAIIRGGGGDVGLTCFNDYQLSREIALFPIPVLTGIGHATNETVVEMVAYRNAITPTELADFLLQKFHNFSVPVRRAEEVLRDKSRKILSERLQDLQQTVRYFRSVADNVLIHSQHEIRHRARELFRFSNLNLMRKNQEQAFLLQRLRGMSQALCHDSRERVTQSARTLGKVVSAFVKEAHGKVAHIERTVSNLHPENVLKRGYTITKVNGKTVTSIHQVWAADVIETLLPDGRIQSEIKTIKNSSTS